MSTPKLDGKGGHPIDYAWLKAAGYIKPAPAKKDVAPFAG